jgi:hypothetical protein
MVVGFNENCRILAVPPPPTVTTTGAVTDLPSAPVAVRV